MLLVSTTWQLDLPVQAMFASTCRNSAADSDVESYSTDSAEVCRILTSITRSAPKVCCNVSRSVEMFRSLLFAVSSKATCICSASGAWGGDSGGGDGGAGGAEGGGREGGGEGGGALQAAHSLYVHISQQRLVPADSCRRLDDGVFNAGEDRPNCE